ncbi:MAG: ABC transporter ATP-binding protein [Candidatus Njordarchaeia archaeon]
MALLEVKNLKVYIGDLYILQGLNLKIGEKTITALIGRNGAGKTTLMKTIMGLIKPVEGEIIFNKENITGQPPYIVSRKGIAYVPSERAIFTDLTVEENLKLAYRGNKNMFQEKLEYIFDIFPDLKKFYKQKGRNLSGGQQKMLAIACGIINENKLIMLDEPTEGLSPKIVADLLEVVKALKEKVTIFLVEQNYRAIKETADYAYIIDKGVIVESGAMEEISKKEEMLKKYLGIAF